MVNNRKFADGNVELAGAQELNFGQALAQVFPNKDAVKTLVQNHFQEIIFDLNWTTWQTAIASLISYCKQQRQLSKLVEAVEHHAGSRFSPTITPLLGAGIIVPFEESQNCLYQDLNADQLQGTNLDYLVGTFVLAFPSVSSLQNFADKHLPGWSQKVDWHALAPAARSLVTLAIQRKSLGFLMEKAAETTQHTELNCLIAWLLITGTIKSRKHGTQQTPL